MDVLIAFLGDNQLAQMGFSDVCSMSSFRPSVC